MALGGRSFASSEVAASDCQQDLPTGDGEEFWEALRAQYDLPEATYLNTATLGLMAKPVLADVQLRMKSLSQGRYAIDEGPREAVARLIGAPAAAIAMTHNTTEGINIVAQGLRLRRGDEVIITDQEHVGNALPWLNRARLTGIRLRVLHPAPTADETMDRIAALITRRTRVIAVPHVTCTTGQVLPAKAIAQLAREKNIVSMLDGAHGPGMLFPNMAEIGCDFYASCGHKWVGGPAGTGFLYVRPEMLGQLEALMVGAYSDTGWEVSTTRQTMTALVDTAHRFDYGTQNVALHMGFKAAIEFLEGIGTQKISARINLLASYLQQKLIERPFVEMLTPTEEASRAAIISFNLRGKGISDLDQFAVSNRFRIRIVSESGLNAMRISAQAFTTHQELDRLVASLDNFMQI